ncbi:hypothetical protein MH215_16890 [Paenibacillus sp. ACRSA]|uniref:hypothetical protein n=1 Tax=Paenibacillus sp. ACRSA TaxID=2918211 RepID=UPI001EF3D7AA|nr:hypothetical protein [Paenibacillus sp. ACRSA]MCG7378686.1 hypothetical protein [Paenibacillus sp. ACRSA]
MTNKNLLLLVTICIIMVVGITIVVLSLVKSDAFSFLNQFRSFTVTIDNQSDFNLSSVETGVLVTGAQGVTVESGSKDMYGAEIKSGEVIKIRPNLSLSGEGGIYLKITDSNGETTNKMICSYTESLSGYSNVIVTNNNVSVKEQCN